MALLSSVDSIPRAYRLKVSNAALSEFQQWPGHPLEAPYQPIAVTGF